MQPPQIGITVLNRDSAAYKNYVQRVREAGGVPVELAPDDAELANKAANLDGLLLTGGGDVEPSHYGEAPHPQTGGIHPELDAAEIGLVQQARRREIPILAICRGHQLLNVALGGRLLQHLEGDAHRAHATDDHPSRWHEVQIEPHSRLQALLGAESLEVNSRHHQAVLPEMVAPGLRPTAYSPDGLVEGMEGAEASWITSVQWHPERPEAIDRCRALFDDFIAATAAARARGEATPAD